MSSCPPSSRTGIFNACRHRLKKLKKARNSAGTWWRLPAFVALLTAISLAPLFGARAANLAYGTFNVRDLFSQAGGGFRFLPRSATAFLTPQEDPPPNQPPDLPEVPGADMAISKTVGSETAAVGSNVTFTIEVVNNGPIDAVNAAWNDTLPAGMTYVSVTQTSGPTFTCQTPNLGEVTCSITNLAPSTPAVFSLVANIPANPETSAFFTNVVGVTTDSPDPNDENNSSSASVSVAATSADVSVTKHTDSETVRDGSDVTYTIEVVNNGPDSASVVEWEDTLPGDMTFISLTQTSGPTFTCPTIPAVGAGGAIKCSIASLEANTSAVFSLVVNIPSGTPDNTTYQNTVTVTTDTHDTNDENNQASPTLTAVNCFIASIVTTSADSGPGSLRQAILETCPGGTIQFSDAVTGIITLTSGELLVNKSLRIQGPGANRLMVRRSSDAGTPDFSIFRTTGGQVVISGLTISNGKSATGGGGIVNDSTVFVVNTLISDNSASNGGGISNSGTAHVINSTVSNNTATTSAGGIYNFGAGTLNVVNSTVSGNTAQSGGSGGGVANSGTTSTANIINSTVAGNTAGTGGGIANTGTGTVNVRNSIAAWNAPSDLSGTITSQGHNIVQSTGSATIGSQTGDQFGADPRLEMNAANPGKPLLKNNGGPTPTHALLAGSPALDAGSNALLPTDTADLDNDAVFAETIPFDQRGFLRTADAADAGTTQTTDIGAFEAQVSVEDITDKATNEDTPLSFSFNVGDATLGLNVAAVSGNGALVPNTTANLELTGTGSTRTLNITPAPNLSGTTTITVTVNNIDGQTMLDTFVLTVNAQNDAPQAADDGYSASESTALSVAAPGVLINDTDLEGSGLTATKVSNPSNGTVALNTDGSFIYTPNPSFTGTDSFTYKANDGSADSNVATVTITVNEGGTLQFNAAASSVNESAGSAVITITRTNGSAGTATVLFSTGNGTAGSDDYTSVSQTVTFNEGETSKTINVAVNNDAIHEADETVNLMLSNAGGSGQLGSPTTAVLTITNDDLQGGTVSLGQPTYSISEDAQNTPQGFGSMAVEVVRTGDASTAATVQYSTSDTSGGNECNQVTGQASQRCDYLLVAGTLRFAAGETTKTINIPIVNDGYVENTEFFAIQLQNAVGTQLGATSQATLTILDDDNMPSSAANNPYLSVPFFVRMNYLDYLGRDADQQGFTDWVAVLNNCGPQQGFLGAPPECDRAHVSHGFFAAPESIDRGFLIYRMYEVGLGRLPRYAEFIPDMASLSGFGIPANIQQQNLQDYLQQFTARQEFQNRLTGALLQSQASELISRLEQAAGIALPATATTGAGQPTQYGRSELISKRQSGEFTVGQTLKAFVEQQPVYDRYFPRAAVTMEYFAHLRRDPDLNDPNLEGWKEWVDVFTNGRPNQGIQPRDIHHLIFGFIYSEEYRKRFGQP